MSGETVLTVVGNLTDAPELRYTQNGIPVANLTVASTPRLFNKQTNEWQDAPTLYQRCTLWREYAEHAAASLSKGDRVIVSGTLGQESYETAATAETPAQKRTVTLLTIEDIGPALKYARATVHKVTKQEAPASMDTRNFEPAGAVA